MKIKNTTTILVTLIFILICYKSYSQTVDAPYEVGTWYGFRSAAVSFTFDDGCSNQFAIAIPMFNEFGYRLTLFIPTRTSWLGMPNWTKLQNAVSQGHEVAAHSLTHTSFTGMSEEDQTIELSECQNDINSHIPGNQCVTFAYPYCHTGTKSIVSKYYIAAHICPGNIEPKTPHDFMNISSIVCGTESSVKTAENFLARASSALRIKGWCVYLLHGIDNDGGWSPVTSATLRETLQLFRDNSDDYWVDTFANVVRYIKERDDVSVTELSSGDSSLTVQVTDTLNDTLFNHPVTLRRPFPDGWISATVTQNGHSVVSQIVKMNSIQYIQFDAVPDSGNVVILRSNIASIQHDEKIIIMKPTLLQNYPNPFNPATTISFELSKSSQVSLKVFDLLGREIEILVNQELPAGQHTTVFHARNLASGMYFYRLRGADFIL